MSRGLEILQLEHELREMPEYRLSLEIQSLSQSIYVFDTNFVELERFLNFLANDSRADSLFWPGDHKKLQKAAREIIRLIHNFVSSASSLIDHTRRLYNKLYRDTEVFPDYPERIKSVFAHDPLSQFVRDLRRYCQHFRAPNISFIAHAGNLQNGLTRSIELPLENLYEFDGWSHLAKRYLRTFGSGIDILEIAVAYRSKVIGFYKWFQQRQSEIHETDLRRFREKESRLLTLQLEQDLDLALADADFRRGRRDAFFLQILAPREMDALEAIPQDSIERPARAIKYVEEHMPISEELKKKIYQLYEHTDLFTPRVPPTDEESGNIPAS